MKAKFAIGLFVALAACATQEFPSDGDIEDAAALGVWQFFTDRGLATSREPTCVFYIPLPTEGQTPSPLYFSRRAEEVAKLVGPLSPSSRCGVKKEALFCEQEASGNAKIVRMACGWAVQGNVYDIARFDGRWSVHWAGTWSVDRLPTPPARTTQP